MAKLDNPQEMKLIYDTCRQVFLNKLSPKVACKLIEGKTSSSMSSLLMYLNIYACMRKGICYKMGTSAAFTKYLAENIYSDNGQEAMLIALAAAKQNAEYRIS